MSTKFLGMSDAAMRLGISRGGALAAFLRNPDIKDRLIKVSNRCWVITEADLDEYIARYGKDRRQGRPRALVSETEFKLLQALDLLKEKCPDEAFVRELDTYVQERRLPQSAAVWKKRLQRWEEWKKGELHDNEGNGLLE